MSSQILPDVRTDAVDERPIGPHIEPMQTKRTQRMGRPRGKLFRKVPEKWAANPENLSDVNVLNLAIQLSKDPTDSTPITDKVFAEMTLHCDSRTLRKYREGRALPKLARSVCEEICRQHANS